MTLFRLFNNGYVLIILLVIGISVLEKIKRESQAREQNQILLEQYQKGKERAGSQESLNLEQYRMQAGSMRRVADGNTMSQQVLEQSIAQVPKQKRFYSYWWKDRRGGTYAYSATGVDNNHYFANSYLVGFMPFKTNSVWEPLATLAMRKHYMLDHHLYGPGMNDIWQNSKQAYVHSHGDCEDHAIVLVDWLIALGYSAKVAIGETPQGGHAWVILYYQGQEYILEATGKRRPRAVSDFIIAKYATDYWPRFLFNRAGFWENTGSIYTTDYSGSKWKLQSRFIRNSTTPVIN